MNYTSGTTGTPEGRAPPAAPHRSRHGRRRCYAHVPRACSASSPEDDNVHLVGSPLYHTAVLMFAGGSLHFGHTVVLMDKWTPEDMLRLIEQYRVTTSHMVPTQFHRLLALPDEVREALRRVVAART